MFENYVMKKHTEQQMKRWSDWFNVQPYSYHQPVYMQLCPSGCAGQSKILTVLLLAEWNGYSMTPSLTMELQHTKKTMYPTVHQIIPNEIIRITLENTNTLTSAHKKWKHRGKVNSETKIPKYKNNVYLTEHFLSKQNMYLKNRRMNKIKHYS